MFVDRSAGWTAGRFGAVVVACAALFSAVGCSTDAGTGVRLTADAPDARASAAADHKAPGKGKDGTGRTPGARPVPSGPEPAVLGEARVNISDGQTVGVGMPISVTFSRSVPAAERKGVESWLRVQTSSGTTGAWSWVKDTSLLDGQRVDFRPSTAYWQSGTRVTLRLGSHGARHVTIGRSLVATVDAKTHTMTVRTGGTAQRIPGHHRSTGDGHLERDHGRHGQATQGAHGLPHRGPREGVRRRLLLGRAPDDVGDVRAPEPAGGHRGRTPQRHPRLCRPRH